MATKVGKRAACAANFGRAVRAARLRRHLTGSELAELVGKCQPDISAIENGRRVPEVETVLLLENALGVVRGGLFKHF